MTAPASGTIVFCDFDDTITVNETLSTILLHFAPEVASPALCGVSQRHVTLREALTLSVQALPSALKGDILEYIAAEPLRAGFGEFLDFLAQRKIPFVVLSSGLCFYIEAKLAPWNHRIHAIHALDVDMTGPLMLLLPHSHPTEAMPKHWVMEDYAATKRIVVGDSYSDFEMAAAADMVFARNRLLRETQSMGRPVIPFDDFFDISRAMERMEEEGA